MKLFNAIAAAAVIGASFIAAHPAEARNGWVYVTTDHRNVTTYIKPLQFSGQYRKYVYQATNMPGTLTYVADCQGWRVRVANKSEWRDILPRSVGNTELNIVCR